MTLVGLLEPVRFGIFSTYDGETNEKLFKALRGTGIVLITTRGYRFHPKVIEFYERWGDIFLEALKTRTS